MFLEKAKKQIKNGSIKVFSILKGKLKNQGERIILAKDEFEVWDCPLEIGKTK